MVSDAREEDGQSITRIYVTRQIIRFRKQFFPTNVGWLDEFISSQPPSFYHDDGIRGPTGRLQIVTNNSGSYFDD